MAELTWNDRWGKCLGGRVYILAAVVVDVEMVLSNLSDRLLPLAIKELSLLLEEKLPSLRVLYEHPRGPPAGRNWRQRSPEVVATGHGWRWTALREMASDAAGKTTEPLRWQRHGCISRAERYQQCAAPTEAR